MSPLIHVDVSRRTFVMMTPDSNAPEGDQRKTSAAWNKGETSSAHASSACVCGHVNNEQPVDGPATRQAPPFAGTMSLRTLFSGVRAYRTDTAEERPYITTPYETFKDLPTRLLLEFYKGEDDTFTWRVKPEITDLGLFQRGEESAFRQYKQVCISVPRLQDVLQSSYFRHMDPAWVESAALLRGMLKEHAASSAAFEELGYCQIAVCDAQYWNKSAPNLCADGPKGCAGDHAFSGFEVGPRRLSTEYRIQTETETNACG